MPIGIYYVTVMLVRIVGKINIKVMYRGLMDSWNMGRFWIVGKGYPSFSNKQPQNKPNPFLTLSLFEFWVFHRWR